MRLFIIYYVNSEDEKDFDYFLGKTQIEVRKFFRKEYECIGSQPINIIDIYEVRDNLEYKRDKFKIKFEKI